jgi:hypothetical protein
MMFQSDVQRNPGAEEWPFTRMMATRTQPKSLSASRSKRRPELEGPEEKTLLSLTFGTGGRSKATARATAGHSLAPSGFLEYEQGGGI